MYSVYYVQILCNFFTWYVTVLADQILVSTNYQNKWFINQALEFWEEPITGL